MCTNFRYINTSYRKDDFSLSNIDIIVDSIFGYEMLSFMDAFLGYNKIKIMGSDQHEQNFQNPWDNFY